MSQILTTRDHYKPFVYPWAFEAYQKMRRMAWEPDEVPLNEDLNDWEHKLTPAERNLLTQLFRFFTQGDVDVASAYRDRYMPRFKHPEIAMMLYCFADAEGNHVHSYSLLLDTIGMPESEYAAFHNFKQMQEKHDYLFAERSKFAGLSEADQDIAALALDIAVFSAFSEGMQLFSSFAMLMSFQPRGLMKGMSTIVEWSIRDENHHVDSMIKLLHTLIAENPHIWTDDFKGRIYQTARDMVALEDNFIDLAFELGAIEGLTPESVKTYIRFIADRRLNQLGLKSNFGVDANPFAWLDWIISAPTHTNFFEQRSTEYSKAAIEGWDAAFTVPVLELPVERHFEVVSKPDCPFCALVKHEISRAGGTFSETVLHPGAEQSRFLATVGVRTFPQVFFEGVRIGGCDATQDYLNRLR